MGGLHRGEPRRPNGSFFPEQGHAQCRSMAEEKLIGSTARGDSIFDRTAVVFCYLQCGGDRQCEYRSRRVPAALCPVALGPSRHCGGSRLELCGVFGFHLASRVLIDVLAISPRM